ncbi:MAG: metal-dependent hydrolase [Deltaproteobacteria bacterium RBG_16_58_17]|nr:MAG: metal-dependent hydrolase [Deltaproteobacteria bacterium RBG_16_58_17]OHE18546.1 MAG: metal-dependent hydrolase [Syntrophobacterales bacterium GWC2_56_13]
MKAIDPHIHMISRTTDDYLKLAVSGIHVVTEPAFWAGYDRCSAGSFRDYFHQLTVAEPARAARFGIRHYCWIGLNSKEAEDIELSEEVLALIPEYLDRETVLGLGEIGLNKNSRNEIRALERQLALAAERNDLVLIHTPHLEDKLKGTRIIMDMILSEPRIKPERVLIDHAEEHTIGEIREKGFWYGLTLYPHSKGSPERAVDAVEIYGPDRVCINSSADWSVSDPLATLKTANEMRRRGHPEELINRIFYENPKSFLGQCPKFHIA